MNRTHRAVRASFYLALALPFAALACGQSFTAGPGDGGEESGIVFGDAGEDHDATSNGDGSTDARQDGPRDGGARDGADGMAESGMHACPSGSLTCSDGGCATEGPANCGTCGNDCTMLPHVMNAGCTAGQCSFTCEPGWQNCTSNSGAGCATDITKQGNCGGCNVTCSGNTPVCGGTGCVSGCDAGQTLCTGSCVNTTTDPQNCNGCGNVCGAGPVHSQPACNGSMCTFSCDTNYQACNGNSCIQISPDLTQVFVAQGGSTMNCGSPSLPCGTIAAALGVVQNSLGAKNFIYVAGSSTPYVEPTPITLPAGVTIQGGWEDVGGQWNHPCPPNPSRVVIEAPAGSNYVIWASYNGSSTLDTLTIVNNTTATTGQSLYGIFAANTQSQTTLVATNVTIDVAAGGSGLPGAPGADGGAPLSSCSSGAGGNGFDGTTPITPLASYGSGGYAPATGGTGGASGDGQPGTPAPGIGAPGGPQCITDAYPSSNTTNLSCCGNYGGFIVGGGCMNCMGSPTSQLCGGVGTNGCGSGGSKPGTGGSGGGASIGVYAWGNVTLNLQGTVNTGAGGTGGAGGTAGNVSPGSAAVAGAPDAYVTACNTATSGTKAECQATSTGGPLSGGAKGGDGGTGGHGGQGGGGTGGDSYCYYANGGANVTASVSCTPGAAGPGGSPNGPNGTSGLHN